jgi:hypothetical protein
VALLRFLVDDAGFLVIAPARRRAVRLRLTPEGPEAFCGSVPPLLLAWDHQAAGLSAIGREPGPDTWGLIEWGSGDEECYGLGLQLDGAYVAAGAQLRRATRRRLAARTKPLPIIRGSGMYRTVPRERDTLRALFAVLSDRPELRRRLAEGGRMQRLAGDLTVGLVQLPTTPFMRRDPDGIIDAMEREGLGHPYGRPLPGQPRVDGQAVLDAMRARIAREPKPTRPTFDDTTMERVVRRVHLDVTPWPFGALFER